MNYKNIYYNIINNRIKNKYEGYTESHHILPKSLGGSDEKTNLVDLSAREHYICHLLLTKMFDKDSPEYFKMIHAYMMMCNAQVAQSTQRSTFSNINNYFNALKDYYQNKHKYKGKPCLPNYKDSINGRTVLKFNERKSLW